MVLLVAGLATCAATSTSLAGQISYYCSVRNVYHLGDDATISKNPRDTLAMRNATFRVDRMTGFVAGEKIPAIQSRQSQVLSSGDGENPFKSYFKDYNFTSYLEIYEHKKGPQKPFILHDADVVYTGFCE